MSIMGGKIGIMCVTLKLILVPYKCVVLFKIMAKKKTNKKTKKQTKGDEKKKKKNPEVGVAPPAGASTSVVLQAKCRCTSLFVATSWRWPFLWCCSTSYQNWSPLHCSNGGSTVPSSQSPVTQTSTSSLDMHPSKHNVKPEVWHVHCLPKLSGLNYWTGLLDSSPHARSAATGLSNQLGCP